MIKQVIAMAIFFVLTVTFLIVSPATPAEHPYANSKAGGEFATCVTKHLGTERIRDNSLLAKDLSDEGFRACKPMTDAFIEGVHNDPLLSTKDKAYVLNQFLDTLKAMKIALTKTILQVRIYEGQQS